MVPDVRSRALGALTHLSTGWSAVVVLLLAYYLLAVAGSVRKSLTCDEPPHLLAGYSFWTLNDYRFNPENGNLPARWAALPLLLQNVRFSSLDWTHWHEANVWEFGKLFFYNPANNLSRMVLTARAMIAISGLAPIRAGLRHHPARVLRSE